MDTRVEALAAAAAVDRGEALVAPDGDGGNRGDRGRGGVNRAALSDEDRRARRLMVEWAGELGFEVATDGNRESVRPPSRPAGGCGARGDGAATSTASRAAAGSTAAYGVIGGFEALEAIARAGVRTERPHRPRRLDQ